MTSSRLLLCLIISLTGFGFTPGSVAGSRAFQDPGTKTYQIPADTPLQSKSWHPPLHLVAAQSPSQANFLEPIAKNQPQRRRSKKDLFWTGVIIFSMVFSAAIFAGLFYLLTSSSFEDETEASTNPENSEPKSSPEINSQDLSDELNSANHPTANGISLSDPETGISPREIPAPISHQTGDNEPSQDQVHQDKNLSEISPNIPGIAEQPPAANPEANKSNQLNFISKLFFKKTPKSPNSNQQKPTKSQRELLKYTKKSAKIAKGKPEVREEENRHNLPDLNRYSPPENQQIASESVGKNLAINETNRLAKIDRIEELIRELQSPDPIQRRKSIWELSQRGDSRAVQPLVDLMINSDSKQVSLILGALSEIGTRTLKPINRALALSLQDRNPDVRKNAIRDLIRIYDLINQVTLSLNHAVNDPDPEVQETARWALSHLSQLSLSSGYEVPSVLPHGTDGTDGTDGTEGVNIEDNSPEKL